jgi:heme-degrading monooxygenase HmoA
MYIRIVRVQPQPGQADEAARRWKEQLVPRLRELPGFRQGYISVDRTANRIAGVTFWDAEPDNAANELAQSFGQQVADIMTGPPEIATYEVLEEA